MLRGGGEQVNRWLQLPLLKTVAYINDQISI